jgi:hypothetical protein
MTIKPKPTYTHSQIANNPAFAHYLPTTKVALLAGMPHSKILSAVTKTCAILNEPLIERHGLLVAIDTEVATAYGYTVSPTVALLVALQFNVTMRNNLLNHVQDIDETYYNSLLDTITARPKSHLPMHKRITYAPPTAEPTGDTFIRHSPLSTKLKTTVPKLYLLLIEAGLVRHMPKDKIYGYKVTTLGSDYIREYRTKETRYLVFDYLPVIDILRSIAALKV